MNISSNPSSWFADCFVDFYNEQLEQGNSIHSHIYTGNTRKIIKRVSEYLDEMGFVYILESQMFQFEYMIKRNHLEFIPLTTMKETLYPGKKNPYYGQNEIPLEVIEHMQFVQNFQDEFVENMDVAVVTNSDYIMQQMLKKSPLANISGTYMNGRTDYNDHRGILLNWENNQMFYGVIYRKDEKLSPLGRSYLDFVKERIIKE